MKDDDALWRARKSIRVLDMVAKASLLLLVIYIVIIAVLNIIESVF